MTYYQVEFATKQGCKRGQERNWLIQMQASNAKEALVKARIKWAEEKATCLDEAPHMFRLKATAYPAELWADSFTEVEYKYIGERDGKPEFTCYPL